MKAMKKWIGSGVLVATLTVLCVAQSPWDQLRQKAATAAKAASANRGLSNDKIVAGLKEALTVSTRNAVAATGTGNNSFAAVIPANKVDIVFREKLLPKQFAIVVETEQVVTISERPNHSPAGS